ncbi:hypothetical protein IJT93_11145 [bacterium]|nr:hypothetical protein [bacterium]
MRFKHLLLASACVLAFAGAAQADNHFTTARELSSKGVDVKNFIPVCFSPDGNSILGFVNGGQKALNKDGHKYSFVTIDVAKDGTLGRAKFYPVNVPHMEQVTYTPDGGAVIFTSRAGATFEKLNLQDGKVTTIMEHKYGTPGFRCYPLVMTLYGDKIVVQGYYYDNEDFGGRDSIAELHPDKTGVEAFAKIAEIQKAKTKARKDITFYHENFTSPENAFLVETKNNHVNYMRWKIGDESLKLDTFDEGMHDVSMWGAKDRLVYTICRSQNKYDLVVYDAKADKRSILAASTQTPYTNLFLSDDGTTALFSDYKGLTSQKGNRCKTFYARESEGWEIKPVPGYNELSHGLQRISADGKRMFMFNESGMRVFDLP